MKRINGSKYKKWCIDRISLSLGLFSIDVSRHWIERDEYVASIANKFRTKIFFVAVDRVVLSNFSCGAEISRVEQRQDEQGKIVYTLSCSPESFVQITAEGFAEIPF
jgi:hypothetical protein